MLKGLICAGGMGTRLAPITRSINKHLVPVLNNPMILYPLETLKALGIKDIMIVSGGDHIGGIAEFFGDGSEYGVNLTYRVQKEAGGIAQAIGLAKGFADDNLAVILGDNIFDNKGINQQAAINLDRTSSLWTGRGTAAIFLARVKDPQRFGVPVFGKKKINGKMVKTILKIEEKPKEPKSQYAVTGLYIYPCSELFEVIKNLKPSKRGELEVTDINNYFIKNQRMCAVKLNTFWSDAGTRDSLKRTVNWAYQKGIK